MTQQEVTILNRAGIHARPASLIVKTANKYKSDVFLEMDGMKINAKSIMGIITLGASHKTKLILSANGPDEEEMVKAIAHLFETRFEEE